MTFKAPQEADQTPAIPLQATLPRISIFYNNTLGTFLPKIANPEQYLVDVGFFFALIALVVYWFIVSRTTFGYNIRVIGQNLKAARYAGIPVKRDLFLSMAIAGAFSGLAGALHLMGQFPYQLIGDVFRLDTTGFDAIGVALLGRNTAIGVLLASLLFGGLRQGASLMQLQANIPADLVFIIQALVLFSIASEFLPAIQRSLPRWVGLWRKPALTPPIMGTSVVAIPQHGDNLPLPDGAGPAPGQNGDNGLNLEEPSSASTGSASTGSGIDTKRAEEE